MTERTAEQGKAEYVYIAGPYGDAGGYLAIDRNIATARYWAARLAEARVPFFCPHLNSAHFEVITPEVPADWWVQMDMIFLEQAAAMLLLPGWHRSSGTARELAAFGQPATRVFIAEHQFPELLTWWAQAQKVKSGDVRQLVEDVLEDVKELLEDGVQDSDARGEIRYLMPTAEEAIAEVKWAEEHREEKQ